MIAPEKTSQWSENLRVWLAKNKVNQRDLACAIGVTDGRMSNLCKGVGRITGPEMIAISSVTGMSEADLKPE